MQIFKSESEARKSLHEKEKVYINSLCPFDCNGRVCGSWCALFYYDKGTETRTGYIILGCKGTDKKLYTD
jgi:hypothetical protein